MKKNLYFFTSSYPFGTEESFIENEIPFLSKAFDNITIIPLFGYNFSGIIRAVPINCRVLQPVIRSKFQHFFIVLFIISAFRLYSRDFFSRHVYKKAKWLRMFLIDLCTTNNILKSKLLKKLLSQIQKDDVMYFYWGKGISNVLPFISHVKAIKVVRLHRGDLYEYLYEGYLPIQEAILKEANIIALISKHGQSYLKKRYPHLYLKTELQYLGTNDHGVAKQSTDDIYRVLSCSNVIPNKRLFLLFESLQSITDLEIEWTHIGDGADFEDLRKAVRKSRLNINVRLLGRLSNQQVLLFYQNNRIDTFVSVSSSEGLPVSLMEAISFNVPVIGTDVGGTSEIVTPETGILLSSNPNVSDIIESLKKIRFMTLRPKLFWEKNFNATINYPMFINRLLTTK